jgi:tetratricopeptide (TPR) repeat protein
LQTFTIADSLLRTPDLAFQRFVLEQKAGSGGMGTVYRALDRTTGERVALKVIRKDDDVDEERFAREALALSALKHPGIVRYVAHGRGDDGHYLAMEWLEGEDLSTRLSRSGLTLAESLALAKKIADALATAHAKGIVHRDIKPRNIFLAFGELDRVKVIDFGIARFGVNSNMTITGAMLGTPGYMAPEQAEGARDVDARADVFSLGCVLFKCLTGEPAFPGDNVLAILAKTVLEETPRVRDLRADVPEALDAMLVRWLSKSRSQRPIDGAAAAREIELLGALPEFEAAPPSRAPVALTEGEKRMLCVVIAGGSSVRSEEAGTFAASRAKEAAVRIAAEQNGGSVESLADGSHLVTISGRGAATDLAAQAARCALALRDLLPSMPIAVATGAGVFSTQKSSRPVGALVDRAASMLAEGVEGVRLDDATAGLLDVRFVVVGDERGLCLRGEREVLEGQRTLLGKPYPCVGRERELAFLEAILAESENDSVARVALVTGSAGRGKSRIRFELLRRAKESGRRFSVLFARGDSVSAGAPFAMLGPAIRRAAGVLEGEAPSVTKKRLRARVGRHLRADLVAQTADFLGEMVGVPPSDDDAPALAAARRDPVLMGDAMQSAFATFLDAETQVEPVLLVLEDLHWGDVPSVRFVDGALRQLASRRFAVVAFARPEVFEAFPNLWAEREVQEMRLGALSPKASERLVHEVLGDRADAETVERIVDRSGGNAFYLEELIRAVALGMPSDALPETVLGMVQVRLDTLGSEAKRVLRAASIFGQSFWRGGVVALLGGEVRASKVKDWLDELCQREIIASQGDGGPTGDVAYIFRHALLRDAAYAMLTDHDRELGNRLAGEWLELAVVCDPIVLAEHFDRGGLPERAIAYFYRAAEQALEGNDLAAAIDRAERGIIRGAERRVHGGLRLIASEAHKWRGNLADAYAFGVEAARHLDAGAPAWFRAVGEVISLAAQLARIDDLGVWVAEAVRAEAIGDAVGPKVIALCRSVAALIQTGHRFDADRILDHVQRLAPNLARLDRLTAARVHNAWAVRGQEAGHFRAAHAEHTAALIAFEEGGDLRNAALTRINLGVELTELGEHEAAEVELRHALRIAERLGLSNVAAWAHNNLGNVLHRLGRAEDARRPLELAIAVGRDQQSRRLEVSSRVYLSRVHLLAGDVASAVREAEEATALARDLAPLRAVALAVTALALLAGDRNVEALECADEAMGLIEPLHGAEGEAVVRLAHVEALAANGDRKGAHAAAIIAKQRLVARAMTLDDERSKDAMLTRIPDHVRLLALADLLADQ